MAVDLKPSSWIPSWSENGTDVTFPIASVPEMTAAEADADSGDIRKVVFALLEKLFAVWTATNSADRPTKMTISKSTVTNVDTGVVTNTYTIRCYCKIAQQDVDDEA